MRCVLISVNFGKNENWMKFTSAGGELVGGGNCSFVHFKCHLLTRPRDLNLYIVQ